MRIDEAEARRRLTSSRNLVNLGRPEASSVLTPVQGSQDVAVTTPPNNTPVTHEEIIRGGVRGRHVTPEPIRDLIGLLGENQSAASVARAFGVSGNTAERAVTGRVGGRPATEERAAKVHARKLEIQDTALTKLMASLNLIDEEKLADTSAKDLSVIAGNMAKINANLEGQGTLGNNISITVYAPAQKEEHKYKTIDV